jgi:hypothetical protein
VTATPTSPTARRASRCRLQADFAGFVRVSGDFGRKLLIPNDVLPDQATAANAGARLTIPASSTRASRTARRAGDQPDRDRHHEGAGRDRQRSERRRFREL